MLNRKAAILCVVIILASSISYSLDVWAIGEGIRIDAVTGIAHEESDTYLSTLETGYKASNTIWDGQNINIKAAKNEIVSFQVIVERQQQETVSNLTIEFDSLIKNDNENVVIQKRDITIFREWYIEVEIPSQQITFDYFHSLGTGWYPDPLIDLDNQEIDQSFREPLSIPSSNIGQEQILQALWIDIYIPKNVLEGEYIGTINVSCNYGQFQIPINLTVGNFTLPDKNNCLITGMAYSHSSNSLFKMCKRHRVLFEPLNLDPYFTEFGSFRTIEDSICWECDVVSGKNYDELYGPLFDGSLFTEQNNYRGPGMNTPVERFTLPFRIASSNFPPYAYNPLTGEPDEPLIYDPYSDDFMYEHKFIDALQQFDLHIQEKGWDNTDFVIFLNEFLDEPRSDNLWYKNYQPRGGYNHIGYFGELIKLAGLQNSNRIKFRNDMGIKDVAEIIDGWTLDSLFAAIGEHNDIYCLCGSSKYIALDAIQDYTRINNSEWLFYYACTSGEPSIPPALLDTETHGLTLWSWISWKYRTSGALHWRIVQANESCWYDPLGHSAATAWGSDVGDDCHGFYNGECALIYHGDYIGYDDYIESIRLKSLRRGEQDYEYLNLISEIKNDSTYADNAAEVIVDRAIEEGWYNWEDARGQTGKWTHDPEVLNSLRYDIFEEINSEVTIESLAKKNPKKSLINIFPNPANPNTKITLRCEKSIPVKLSIYNLNGRLIYKNISNNNTFVWNAKDMTGRNCSSGMYFIKAEFNNQNLMSKLMLIK